jgi:hypothetical protein
MDYGIGVGNVNIDCVKAFRLYQYKDSLHSASIDLWVVMSMVMAVSVNFFFLLYLCLLRMRPEQCFPLVERAWRNPDLKLPPL